MPLSCIIMGAAGRDFLASFFRDRGEDFVVRCFTAHQPLPLRLRPYRLIDGFEDLEEE